MTDSRVSPSTSRGLAVIVALVAVGCASAPAATSAPTPAAATANGAQTDDPVAAGKRWHALTRAKKADEARALCTPWLASASKRLAAEGHKCLASVELIGSFKVHVGRGTPDGPAASGYDGPGVDRAIDHMTQAIALAPDDLSLHLGRLHIAINSARAAEAPRLLAGSLQRYTGPDATDDWIAASQELWERRLGEVGLEYMRTLEKRAPNDHRVVGNVAAFLIALKRDDEGLRYLQRAVELAPDDAVDTWNLGRFHDRHGDRKSAEPLYRRAVSLEKNAERHQDMACNLGRFLAAEPATQAEGCALADKECGGRIVECGAKRP